TFTASAHVRLRADVSIIANLSIAMPTSLAALPSDWKTSTLLGRAWLPGNPGGPSPITVRSDGAVIDLSAIAPTASAWLERDDLAAALRAAGGPAVGTIADLLANSRSDFDAAAPRLLAPCDLQAITAGGVTVVASPLERVIEERARGDGSRADAIRTRLQGILGDDL